MEWCQLLGSVTNLDGILLSYCNLEPFWDNQILPNIDTMLRPSCIDDATLDHTHCSFNHKAVT